MAYNHQTIRKIESTCCPGVVYCLNKMTEGRRIELRSKINPFNKRIREILKEQEELNRQSEDQRDAVKYFELNDEFDATMIEQVNPCWILWGVKQIEGLEADGKPLTVSDWKEWPSALFNEILDAVKQEAEMNGDERKNSSSLTTSGEPEDQNLRPSIVGLASAKGFGETEIV